MKKELSQDNNISFTGGYKLLNRGFLSTFDNDTTGQLQLEGRYENTEQADLDVNFSLSKILFGMIDISFNNENVNSSYNNMVPGNPETSVLRKLNVFETNFTIEGKLKLPGYVQNTGLSFYTRDKSNVDEQKFDISEFDLQNLRSIDNQRDNNSYRTNFYTKINYEPFQKDTFKFNYSVSLFQYDTPSTLNDDDRDEFNTIINGTYSHVFSNEITSFITASTNGPSCFFKSRTKRNE